jgi:hypothetical protein
MGDTEGYGINFVVMKSSEKMLPVRAAANIVIRPLAFVSSISFRTDVYS